MTKLSVYNEMSRIVRIFHLFAIGPAPPHATFNILSKLYLTISGIALLAIFLSAIVINQIFYRLDQPVGKAVCFGSLLLTHFVIVFQLICYRNEQYQIFSKLREIDEILMRGLKVKIIYLFERYRCYKKFGTLLTIIILIQIAHVINAFLLLPTIQRIYFMHCLLSLTIMRLTCIQVIFYVSLLMTRIEWANAKLLDIMRAKNLRRKSHKLGNWPSNHWPNTIFSLQRRNERDEWQTPASTYHQLAQLKWINALLYDLNGLINTTFGWSLLIITLQYFIDFTLNGYWLFLALQKSEPDFGIVIDCLCMLMPIVLLLWTMCYSCYTCSQMVIIGSALSALCLTESLIIYSIVFVV